ncbi:MAG: hypothetical protein K1X74_13120 [Pirellulales bacterium]|nr:hypothetical protein [Pirellulales bacterium]
MSGCLKLRELPPGLRVQSWIDVAGSGLRQLPWSLRSTRILWRGVPVTDRVAFDPESITVEEILAESNQTIRRTLLDRIGIDRFMRLAHAAVIDEDIDCGGPRRLLRVPAREGEDIVCVEVRCPSTGHRYCLRVPPQMLTCRQAIAWTAGYAQPERYRPAVET